MEDGVSERGAAHSAVRATLSVLGQRLTDDEAQMLGARMPGELARLLDQSEYDGAFDAAELYERVRKRQGVSAGIARERVDIVLRAIGENLDDEVRKHLLRALPAAIGEQLIPREIAPPPEHVPRR
jgi:uncharacterized protein (DUF2267 family)